MLAYQPAPIPDSNLLSKKPLERRTKKHICHQSKEEPAAFDKILRHSEAYIKSVLPSRTNHCWTVITLCNLTYEVIRYLARLFRHQPPHVLLTILVAGEFCRKL